MNVLKKMGRQIRLWWKMPQKIAEMNNKLDILLAHQMIIAKDNPNALFALHNVWASPQIVHHQENLLRYLKLLRPFVSPSLNLVRIGGDNDGGYCMLPPPPLQITNLP
ncbi:hypothetical protein CQA53_09410 [Helicobacter didelphidarum]|uniref:Uncharacterized protein n=1 Tax=Helicobacter didelphidarum TaxID=2040648 RepID=A0A3D8ICH5_9HELI|nr:hypothetical protein [Helicobacter didelphidarum]RDU62241.1 hypothetical protein CQA53_09410 [Helicobacter didelphidarum]